MGAPAIGAARAAEFDVAIVGYGPTGAVAAALLAQAGLSVWVGDRAREVYDKPRAIALDHEIMRLFQQLGLAETVAQWAEPFTPSEYFGVYGRLIKRMTMVEPPYPLAHVPSMVFSQPPVERALRAHVAAQPNVTVRLGTAVHGIAQDADGVTLQWRADDGGAAGTLRARHVIGCDGASSAVRTLIGASLEDLAFDEPWLVVDVQVNDRGLAKLPKTSVQYCEPDRPCTFVIGPGRHRRWEIALNPGEDLQHATTPEATWALLSRWLTPDDGALWRQASYRFHALVAAPWRRGRVFLAGDAAHQQPPFLGQGMCQGIRDVANLAWKLAAVSGGQVFGVAGERLLDSYGTERAAHVRELTRRIKAIGAVICERDADKARARDAALLAECGGVVKNTPRQDVMPRLESGCLSACAGTARGTIFPQPRVAPGDAGTPPMRLDDVLGRGWWLVLDDAILAQVDVPGPVRLARVGAQGLVETEGVLAGWMARHGCHAALVRPDRYVFGTAASAAELGALLAEAACWLAAPAGAVNAAAEALRV